VNIAYIGLDHHHRAPYLESIAQLDATVTSACEPAAPTTPSDVPNLADDTAFYTDPVDLLDGEDVDLLWLTLSNADTPPVVEAALERDVDVFTEKPIARTASDLDPLLATERASEAGVAVSYPWRAHPIAEELRSLAAEDFFGDVRSFDARFVASQLDFRDTDHFLFDADASRGGIVQWLGVHWIDLVPWLLEDPIERVHAQTRSGNPAVDVEDGATLQFETASGAAGSLTCGYYLREGRYDTQIDIFGADGCSSWDPMGPTFGFDGETTLELDRASGDWESTPHRTVTYEYDGAPGYGGRWGLRFIERSLDALASGAEPPVTLDDALTVLRVLDAVYESAETGEWVPVDT
jgi:predicted dehydrogenase